MGARGPAPKPTALRVLHGDRKSRINRSEPRPLDVPMVKPDWLSPEAGVEWDRVMPHLEAMGTVKATDQVALAAYCETYARWRRLTELAARSAPFFNRAGEGEQPVMVKNPVYSQVRDAAAELRVWSREFGFTPSARAGLRVTIVPDSGVERLFTSGA